MQQLNQGKMYKAIITNVNREIVKEFKVTETEMLKILQEIETEKKIQVMIKGEYYNSKRIEFEYDRNFKETKNNSYVIENYEGCLKQNKTKGVWVRIKKDLSDKEIGREYGYYDGEMQNGNWNPIGKDFIHYPTKQETMEIYKDNALIAKKLKELA
jgi:hypothetical protein